jgi:hypothetical protein
LEIPSLSGYSDDTLYFFDAILGRFGCQPLIRQGLLFKKLRGLFQWQQSRSVVGGLAFE